MTAVIGDRHHRDGIDATVRRLTAATFVLWVGAGALLPMLPRYVQTRGARTLWSGQ